MLSAKKEAVFKRKQTVYYALPFRSNPMVAAHDSTVVAYDSTVVERDSTVPFNGTLFNNGCTHSIVVGCDSKQAVCDSMKTARESIVAGNRCI